MFVLNIIAMAIGYAVMIGFLLVVGIVMYRNHLRAKWDEHA